MEKDDVTKEKKSVADTERLTRTFPFRVRTSAYSFEPDGSLILKDDSAVIHDPRCFRNNGIDLSGGSVTDSAGRMTWVLSNFCVLKTYHRKDSQLTFQLVLLPHHRATNLVI
jgi:hypothetical protein